MLTLGKHRFSSADLLIMAIVNRTPDSFYDRGATFAADAAMQRVHDVVAAGAQIVDIGGVKAAPGAEVDAAEEIARTAQFVADVRAAYPELIISVDTWRHEVGRAAELVDGLTDDGALPGDRADVVEGRDEDRTRAGRVGQCGSRRVVVGVADDLDRDDVAAERRHPVALLPRRRARDVDPPAHPERAAGVRQPLPVVARAGAHDPGRALEARVTGDHSQTLAVSRRFPVEVTGSA